jgi:hypothetical protein
MQSFNIEDVRLGSMMGGSSKNVSVVDNAKSNFLVYAAALAFFSVGYHLSVYNSVAVFIWEISDNDWILLSFINVADLAYEGSAFLLASLICFQRIKLNQYKYFFYAAEFLMFVGTLFSFGLLGLETFSIFFGRVITGLSAGITITSVLTYQREVQFHISKSDYKSEHRRFSTEACFALGIFLGLIPAKVLSKLADYQDYELNFGKLETKPADFGTQFTLALLPIIASITRIVLLRKSPDIELPPHAPAYSDEGLHELSLELDPIEKPFSALRFEDTQCISKLLEEPYRKRLDTGYVLYFLQVSMGLVIGVVNPYFVGEFYKDMNPVERGFVEDVQYSSIWMGVEYLLANLVVGAVMLNKKIPRRKIMIFSTVGSTLASLALCAYTFMFDLGNSEWALDLYLFFSFVGLGVCLEIYMEEILPGKGVQLLQTVKWFMIIVVGILTRYFLQIYFFYTILFMFLFLISITGMFVIYILIPESVNVEPSQVDVIFDEIEGEDEPNVPRFDRLSTTENTNTGESNQLNF